MGTTVWLCKGVPLDKEYNHTFHILGGTDTQFEFFRRTDRGNYIYKTYEDVNYQRKDNIMKIPDKFDNIYDCNYLIYQNDGGKKYYCFIKNMTYKSDGLTEVEIETDVLQTYQFDYEVGNSFIEREHVDLDVIGINTIPESLDTGEYISTNLQPTETFKFGSEECCIVLAVTELLEGLTYTTQNYDIPGGLYYIAVKTDYSLKQLIKDYQDGKADAIVSVFIAPSEFFTDWFDYLDGREYKFTCSTKLNFEIEKEVSLVRLNYLGKNYVPRNNKLLTYPYSFLQVSNNSGTVVNYNWEDFNLLTTEDPDTIKFKLIGTLTPGCSFKCYPLNYKNIESNYDESITLGKLPIGAWLSDTYTNWLTQNSVNIGIQTASSVASIVGGAIMTATGGGSVAGIGMIAGGVMGIANTLGQNYEHKMIPDQVGGNINAGDVNYQFGHTEMCFKRMSIKNEYAAIIDNYFDRYGYKVNRFGIPLSNHRAHYWYTKTIDVNIKGVGNNKCIIPEKDKQKIRECYNKGITFWRSSTTFRGYSVPNSIKTI